VLTLRLKSWSNSSSCLVNFFPDFEDIFDSQTSTLSKTGNKSVLPKNRPGPARASCQQVGFFPRDAMLSAVYATPIPYVCLCVTRVYCIKTAECIIEILSPSDRSIILVFRHQGSLCKSGGVTPNRGAKYKGGSDFRPMCGYISETVRDKGIVTMEDEYKVVCTLSNGAAFDNQFQGHSIV